MRYRNNFFHNSPFNFISTWLSIKIFNSNFNIFPLLCMFLCQSTYQFNKYITSNYVCHCVNLLINSIYFLFCMFYNCFGVNLLINSITMYEYFLYNVCIDVNLPNNSMMIIYAFDNHSNKIWKSMFNQHLSHQLSPVKILWVLKLRY